MNTPNENIRHPLGNDAGGSDAMLLPRHLEDITREIESFKDSDTARALICIFEDEARADSVHGEAWPGYDNTIVVATSLPPAGKGYGKYFTSADVVIFGGAKFADQVAAEVAQYAAFVRIGDLPEDLSDLEEFMAACVAAPDWQKPEAANVAHKSVAELDATVAAALAEPAAQPEQQPNSAAELKPRLLEPDAKQLGEFIEVMFKHATRGAFVSLRAFEEGRQDKPPFQNAAVEVGSTPELIVKRAIEIARVCARAGARIVFSPPIVICTGA
jgi:hypothetical protein